MKKLIAIFLTVILISLSLPVATAVNDYEYLPTIYIRGNGEALYYPDGTRLVASFEDLSFGTGDSGIDKDVIVETVVNILKPFVIEGMIFDDYFYPSGGMAENSTAADYNLWKNSGTSMTIGDWRRQHVNDAIKEI